MSDGIAGETLLFQGLENLDGGKLVGGLVKLDRIVVVEKGGRTFSNGSDLLEPQLMFDVGLITAFEPVGDVFCVKFDAELGHFEGDLFVG